MNQLGLFGGRDKVIWQQEAMPWMAPAHECLHAVGLAAAKVDDWLIVQQQLELIDGGTQGGDQRSSDRWIRPVVGRVDAVAGPRALRHVHGDVGMPGKCGGVIAMLRVDRDPDAGSDFDGVLSELKRCFDRLKDFSGDENRAWRICGPSRQDDKLVSTEATHRVRFAEDSSQTSSNFLEYAIAMLVTERVVDLLEAIQVEDEECLRLSLALCAKQRLLEPVHEECAIWKSGETVVERLVFKSFGLGFPLGDVTQEPEIKGAVAEPHLVDAQLQREH